MLFTGKETVHISRTPLACINIYEINLVLQRSGKRLTEISCIAAYVAYFYTSLSSSKIVIVYLLLALTVVYRCILLDHPRYLSKKGWPSLKCTTYRRTRTVSFPCHCHCLICILLMNVHKETVLLITYLWKQSRKIHVSVFQSWKKYL